MKKQPLRSLAVGGLLLGLMLPSGRASAEARDERAGEAAPLVALLTPRDGAALNAAELRVQALVAAFTPRSRDRFVFNGQTVAGRNTGRIGRVEVALDGVAVEQVDVEDCRRQAAIDARIDLTGLLPGSHTISVTAVQGHPRAGIGRSVSATFTVDPALPLAEMNRVEEAATPEPFACLSVPDDNGDEDHDRNWQRSKRLRLEGRFVLGQHSDGIDLTRDRVVIAMGSHLAVLEPGMLQCKGRQKGECRFQDRSQPLVQDVKLERKHDGTWQFAITGGLVPPESDRFYVRIGNDWGGMDLGTGELLVSLRPELDPTTQAQAFIGADGGTIQTTDANGVKIRLDVPPGALTDYTRITLTPLLTSPFPDSSTALHPGVKFEPEGLVFAKPAALTLDFSATGQTITDDQFIFLLTSPTTALPLFGSVDPAAKTLVALLSHFSTRQGGSGNTAQSDPAAWINTVLLRTGNLTLAEIRSLLSALALAQRLGVDGNVNTTLLAQKVQQSLNAMASANCQADVNNPSDAALQRWIDLETLGQRLGANTVAVHGCGERVLEALIVDAGTQAQLNPSDSNFLRLQSLSVVAQSLGAPALETLAWQKLAAALRLLLAQGQQQCPADEAAGRALLNRALQWAQTGLMSTVDPALAADVQSAIDACGGEPDEDGQLSVVNYTSGRFASRASCHLPGEGGSWELSPFPLVPEDGGLNWNVDVENSGDVSCWALTNAAITLPRDGVVHFEAPGDRLGALRIWEGAEGTGPLVFKLCPLGGSAGPCTPDLPAQVSLPAGTYFLQVNIGNESGLVFRITFTPTP